MSHRKGALAVADSNAIENPSSFRQEKRTINSIVLSSSKRVFVLCLAMRMLNSLLVQTYFNPDEHWQALEVAHRITFGYPKFDQVLLMNVTLISFYLLPDLCSNIVDKITDMDCNIQSHIVLDFFVGHFVISQPHSLKRHIQMKAQRMLQSVLSAFGDLYLYKLSKVLFGDHVPPWVLFAQITNWFMFYCITRTLSNSLETVLTLVGLYYWPCMRLSSSKAPLVSRRWGLAAPALACAIRPTSAITWVYVGLLELFVTRDRLLKFIFLEAAPIGGLVLGLTCLLDRLMYGSWVFVPLNFLKFNFLSSGGDYYGTHKWHWYFTQGFPVMLFTFLPFSISGIIFSKQWKLSGLIAWVLGLYSVLGHKEFTFVLPVLPVALMFSGYLLDIISRHDFSNRKRKRYLRNCVKCFSKSQLAIFFLLITNLPVAFYDETRGIRDESDRFI